MSEPLCTAASIHRQVTTIALERGWPAPGYNRVYTIIKALSPALVTLWTLSPSGGVLHFKAHDKHNMNTPNTGRRWVRGEGETDWNMVGGESK